MSELQKQVKRAQWRINLQQFLGCCVWSLAICFSLAAVALGVTKIWPIGVDVKVWTVGWLTGAVLLALVSAGVWTWLRRRRMLDAAIELDRRFGLKERVSSCLGLTPEEADSEVGRALLADAAKRVERLDVREKFSVGASRWALVPLLTAALAVGIVFVPNAKPGGGNEASAKSVEREAQRIKKSLSDLKKKQAELAEDLEKKGLKDASKLVKEVEQGVNDLSKKGDNDRKQAMVKMNDLAKAIKARRENLVGSEELQKRLDELKNLKVSDGPADKLANALKNGDFKAALDELKDLRQQMSAGNLTPEQQRQLAKQMAQMQQKMSDMVAAHEQKKEQLQQKIAELQQQGNQQAAEKLQQQLQKMQAQDQQVNQLQQMANKLGQMAKAMEQGNQQQAAQQMSELAQQLQSMQLELDELKALDEALDQMASARDAMNCEACNGEGCALCQGMGMGFGEERGGMGMGEGQGRGDRPEEETGTNFYDSKVNAKPRGGRMVITGNVRGENKPGDALLEIKQAMEAANTQEESPLTNVRLPRAQLEQAKQYFDAVREGRQ